MVKTLTDYEVTEECEECSYLCALGIMVSVARSAELPSERIARDLRHRIETGELQPGDQLPAVSALAAEHHVSTATVAKAIKVLKDAGLVIARQGWGTFVAEPRASR
jgi:DNA-binding GntR family transcriptional regulator